MKKANELRKIEIIRKFTKYAAGSVLIKWGDTWVLCTASVSDKVPPFLKDSGKGWVTAEYSMLPSCTPDRKDRDIKKLKLDFVELQGTAEHEPFTEESLDALRALAKKGLGKIFALQKAAR